MDWRCKCCTRRGRIPDHGTCRVPKIVENDQIRCIKALMIELSYRSVHYPYCSFVWYATRRDLLIESNSSFYSVSQLVVFQQCSTHSSCRRLPESLSARAFVRKARSRRSQLGVLMRLLYKDEINRVDVINDRSLHFVKARVNQRT